MLTHPKSRAGVADTILFRYARRRGAKYLLNEMYSQIHRVLAEDGVYVAISPRTKLPYLKSEHAVRTGVCPPLRALPNAVGWKAIKKNPLTLPEDPDSRKGSHC